LHYKILGSRKVLQLLADDIVQLHQEFYPEAKHRGMGYIVWRTTAASTKKPSYGQRAEDYQVTTVLLPLISDEDIEARLVGKQAKADNQFISQQERDIQVMARLIKSAYAQGGILSGAELSVLLNRSLTAIGRYLKIYHQQHPQEILPTKGNILDQGSSPTHKGVIIDLYEQGYPEIDIARLTTHNIESVGRYIKTYRDVKLMLEKELSLMEMVRVTGKGRSTIIQYRKLVDLYHPNLKKLDNDDIENKEGSDETKAPNAP
jgi:hypothetical protein